MILEVLSFSLTYFIISEQWSVSMHTHIRNLIFNIHQNYVSFLYFISLKLPPDSKQNVHTIQQVWSINLLSVISTKLILKSTQKSDQLSAIKRSNETIINILKSLCRDLSNANVEHKAAQRPIINAITNIIKQICKCSVIQVREVIHKALKISVCQ